MTKKIVSIFITTLALIVPAAISMHFIPPQYGILVGYAAGLLAPKVNNLVKTKVLRRAKF